MVVPFNGTGQEVFDLFNGLPNEEALAFRRLFLKNLSPNGDELVKLFNAAPPGDRDHFFNHIREQMRGALLNARRLAALYLAALEEERTKFVVVVWNDLVKRFPDEVEQVIFKAADRKFVPQMQAIREADKKARDPKPRNVERDDAIVSLHDEEKLTFGQIPRRLLSLNTSWGRKNGNPLSRDTVERAYHRRKKGSAT